MQVNNHLNTTTMKHLYFFVSTNAKDELSTMTIIASSILKAYALARRAFVNAGYEGEPIQLAI